MVEPHADNGADAEHTAEAGADGANSARPRRADAETLTYLRSLEPLIEQSVRALDERLRGQRQGPGRRGGGGGEEEGDGADEEAAEDRALLVSNLINELTYKVGSLAMDRHAAPVLEKLARLCTRKQLARLLTGCQGYAHCLASNRYSSHVLQTFFSCAGPMVQAELEGVDDDEEEEEEEEEEDKGEEEGGPVLLRVAAAALAQELQASWLDLLYDISGTHTLRALFSLLTGMPAIAERRGRHSKHQHAIETAMTLPSSSSSSPAPHGSSSSSSSSDSPYAARLPMHAVPDEFAMLLESLLVELSRLELMAVHQALCNPNAGPALCLLVQAVARAEGGESLCLREEGSLMQGLVKRALCWARPERCAEVVYAMAGEALSSRFLEAVLWHTAPGAIADPLFPVALQGRLVEFAEHEVANFVLQAWLQRTASPAHLKAALEELAPAMPALVRGRRVGVLWRLAGAAARLGKHEKRVVKALLAALAPGDKAAGTVVRALLAPPPSSHHSAAAAGEGGEEGKEQQPLLLRVREEDGRLQLNVPGARLLDCLMRFPTAELAAPFCAAVAALPGPSLLALAKDNVGSRTLLDPVLLFAATNGSDGDEEGQGRLGDALMGKLRGHYAELAAHPVGFHVLTRAFASCLGLPARRAVAEELLAAESRLAGAHFGRRALGVVGVSLFRAHRGKWEEAMVKGEKKRQVLEELFGMIESEKEGRKGKGKGKGRGKKGEQPKAGKADPLMALLMGEGEQQQQQQQQDGGAAAAGASKEVVPGSLDFVLDALKAGGKKDKKNKKGKGDGEAEAEGEEGGRPHGRPTAAAAHKPSKRREEGQRRREGADKSKIKPGARGGGGGGGGGCGGYPEQRAPPRAGETPVEKAQRLLGKRAMMSRGELLSAVGELEREVGSAKKGKR